VEIIKTERVKRKNDESDGWISRCEKEDNEGTREKRKGAGKR
jgi:hypothetical protein